MSGPGHGDCCPPEETTIRGEVICSEIVITDMFVCASVWSDCFSKCWQHAALSPDCLHAAFRRSSWGEWPSARSVSVIKHLFGELKR